MQGKKLGLVFFVVGAFLVHAYSTLFFLWMLVGIPLAYPLMPTEGVLSRFWGWYVPLGAVLMVVGGLIYGREAKEVIR